MLKIRIVAVGDFKDRWVAEASEHYLKLLSRWAKVEFIIVPSLKASSSLTSNQMKELEAQRIELKLGKGAIIALTDKGKSYDTHAFADTIRKLEQTSSGVVTFLIGGPHGLAEQIINSADKTCSLSPLTFSHQLVRIVLLEQLYRAYSIIHNTDYHK